QDAGPIWRARLEGSLWQEVSDSVRTQVDAMSEYAAKHPARFGLHFLVLSGLLVGLTWGRYRVAPWVAQEEVLQRPATIFQLPLATALVVAVFLSQWIYPRPPRLLDSLLGALALVPANLLLRRVLGPSFHTILKALVVLYFLDEIRNVIAPVEVLARLLFMGEMLGACLFLLWLGRRPGLHTVAGWAALIFAVAFLCAAGGFLSLGTLLGDAALRSAYTAAFLYAILQVADGLCMFALRTPPLSLLTSVRTHRLAIRGRVVRVLRLFLIVVWVAATMEFLSLFQVTCGALTGFLSYRLTVGSLQGSPGALATFVLCVWGSVILSRLTRFFLNEDVYPRLQLERGLPYALSTLLHYALLLLGFLLGLGALGIDTTRFTIIAGALGVGLGFGLQNIVNNFTSGLILLFERPIQVGDVVELGGAMGTLRSVGLRASVVRTVDGSEVIVPNGELISGRVINWTLSDPLRRIDVEVGVAYGTDPARVIQLLTRVGREHPDIQPDPSPQALFLSFGESSLNFQLQAWTENYERWTGIKSELMVEVNRALGEAGIVIPFPQRTLHLENWPTNPMDSRDA
ncbi:MAG: mechanosensitive ion channel domain-containing protein, partial [Candidatus Eremiobacterota bacterium]